MSDPGVRPLRRPGFRDVSPRSALPSPQRCTKLDVVNAAFGRYRLLDRLGQGGMAEVFKAKSYGVEGFEKVLVIKRILPELARSHDFVEMFVHEAKLAVRLAHANIVQVFDLGKARTGLEGQGGGLSETDAYYIAMEYVHGLDLASLLARCRRQQLVPPPHMGVYVASEVAKGLDHAHRRRDEQMRPLGIVHCDVSPQNVLLSFEGEVKVTDFGIAKARGVLEADRPDDTRAKKLQGKFGYMSPEQARGERVDARSDLFSLGTLLYECVAGVNPFSAPTTFETLRRVQACEYPPIEVLRPDASPELVQILRTAMARNAAGRYPDAGRMYEALLALLYSQGSRYGANDLAEFVSLFREGEGELGATPVPMLEVDAVPSSTEHTPVEVSASVRASSAGPSRDERLLAMDRAVEMGERREVTALVIELDRQAPAHSADKAASIVERWGGRVLHREAGHIAALFGLGDPDGRDTEMATRCALVTERSLTPRPPGSGLHTARIHISRGGDAHEDERLGALLSTARELARVREGRVAMSVPAMRQVRSLFQFEAIGEGDRPAADLSCVVVKDVRRVAEAFGRFVGRKHELRRIGEVLARAARRSARAVTLRGDHGIGKTRMLHEVERRLRKGGYNVGFHMAVCLPCGATFPLSGLVCMLQALCGTTEGDTQDRILAVQPRLRALGLQGDEVTVVLIALGASMPPVAGNAKSLLRQAFTRIVHSLCEDRPHALAWDVAHAMDDESYAVLEGILREAPHTRVVLLFAARPGFSHGLEALEGHIALDLDDLALPDLERLVALRLAVDAVPEELLRFVRARAGGHPLFVEEVTKALLDAHAVTIAERRVVSMKLVGQDLALPKTLRGLVASRVARLSSEDRATLQAAAVLGDPFDITLLASMLGQPAASVDRSVARLKEHDFIAHTGQNDLSFTSPLTPEIVADALTPEAAREMHAAAGQALECTLKERADEHAGRIAGHLYEAGDRERAATYFARSGQRRLETRQLETAARDYARAIALTDPMSRSADELATWLEQLASAVRLVRSSPDAPDLCNRVVERADRAGSRATRVRVRVASGHLLAATHRMEAARQCLTDASAIAVGDESLVKPVLLAEAELATRQGDFKRALVVLDELHRVVDAMKDDQEKHRVALHLAQSHAAMGDRATALAHHQGAVHLLPNDRTAALERMKVRALIDYFTRDFLAAAQHCEKAIDLGREMGLTYEVMLNLHHLGNTLVHLEDLPRAYGAVGQSLALCEECGDERFANYNRMLLAFLDGIQGTVDGETLLRQGIAYAEAKDFTADVIGGRLLLANLLFRVARSETARAEYTTTRALAAGAGHRLIADECEIALSMLDAMDGRHEGGRFESASGL